MLTTRFMDLPQANGFWFMWESMGIIALPISDCQLPIVIESYDTPKSAIGNWQSEMPI
jgi:hypothetical protein